MGRLDHLYGAASGFVVVALANRSLDCGRGRSQNLSPNYYWVRSTDSDRKYLWQKGRFRLIPLKSKRLCALSFDRAM